ncbi:hypothetical protein WDC_0353 [Paucilactobacillus wasatchensis]|uniref:Uncharacterized protein n=1 Tax=Paucilactobacillus wasatchensis TaxID=1335616 RepID=A0A0D0YXS8_9LACO|nr:hypothetical protein WDC_0353 [Paucilactobacillus wasatchensis]
MNILSKKTKESMKTHDSHFAFIAFFGTITSVLKEMTTEVQKIG